MKNILYFDIPKLRPFWIVSKNVHGRNTCLCSKHEYIEMVFKRLKEESILKYKILDVAIESDMCCAHLTNECILRKCELRFSKTMAFQEFDATKNNYYDVWKAELEISEKHNKVFRNTVKRRVESRYFL